MDLRRSLRRVGPAPVAAAVFLAVVGALVQRELLAPGAGAGLLPQWDHAAHALVGWEVFDELRRGYVPMFLWRLWIQGLWPFVNSLFLVPHYLLLGPEYASARAASLTAFLLLGGFGSALLAREARGPRIVPVAAFLFLLTTSPLHLAFAGLTMLEMVGSLAQTVVLLAWVRSTDRSNRAAATALAISATVLFFTKFNYFLLLAIPLILHELLERTRGWSWRRRGERLGAGLRNALGNRTGRIVALYLVFLWFVIRTGGFEFHVFGQRVSVHGVGASGYPILYLLLGKAWSHRRRHRARWAEWCAGDARLEPLLRWFGIPVALWFAIPYPNHIQDFAGFLVNRQPEGHSALASVLANVRILRDSYHASPVSFLVTGTLFASTFAPGARRSRAIRCLALVALAQFLLVATHPLQEKRFLFTVLVPLWMTAALRLDSWLAEARPLRAVGVGLAVALLLFLPVGAGRGLRGDVVAAEMTAAFTRSPALVAAYAGVREVVPGDARLLVLGKSNRLSPALHSWQLGPAAGFRGYRGNGHPRRLGDVGEASHVLLVAPLPGAETVAGPEITGLFPAFRDAVDVLVAEGALAPCGRFAVPDLGLEMRIYEKADRAAGDAG